MFFKLGDDCCRDPPADAVGFAADVAKAAAAAKFVACIWAADEADSPPDGAASPARSWLMAASWAAAETEVPLEWRSVMPNKDVGVELGTKNKIQ